MPVVIFSKYFVGILCLLYRCRSLQFPNFVKNFFKETIKNRILLFSFPRFYNFDAGMIFKHVNLGLARYHYLNLFCNFLPAKLLNQELCSQKFVKCFSSFRVIWNHFLNFEEISGLLKAFPFSTSEIFVCKLIFPEKRRFTLLQKILLSVTSHILRLL